LCPGMVCHVGKPEDRTSLINATLEKFGGLDVLGERNFHILTFFLVYFRQAKFKLPYLKFCRFNMCVHPWNWLPVAFCIQYCTTDMLSLSVQCRGESLLWPHTRLSWEHLGQNLRDQCQNCLSAL
jgi:hypothetical protein